jgi:tRNA threonylcarbamoyladenosine biosynthesis protein TsaB
MKLLAIDSTTQRRSVALLLGSAVHERVADGSPQDADMLLPLVRELLSATNCSLRDLDAIAFGAGPGAFTGIRIACGVAQGLALGSSLPVVPVSSLLALAAARTADRVVAALDARMDEIYHAAYEREGEGWRCVCPPSVCSAAQAPQLDGDGWFGAGSGFRAYERELRARYGQALSGFDAAAEPTAAQIARLAALAYARGESVPAHLALPVYVRDKVALTSTEQAALRGGGQVAQNGRGTTPV